MTVEHAPSARAGVAVRADARRNREVVLRAAAEVMAQEGPDVSLDRIARHAGVGAGTVYRHFPGKELLLEAVLAEHVEGLVAAGERWAVRATPGDALFGFLLEVIESSAGRQHVCDALTADRSWPHVLLSAAVRRFGETLDRLLRGARQVGAIRPEVQAADLSALVIGCAALRSAHPDRARGARLVRHLLESLRPAGATGPAVTEPGMFRDGFVRGRDGFRGGERTCCPECGARLPIRATGRPARYCGPTCRQRARRRRLASDRLASDRLASDRLASDRLASDRLADPGPAPDGGAVPPG